MPLACAIERVDPDIAVLTLSGPITLGTNLKTLDSQIQTLADSGSHRLIFDLTAAPYADSAGLGLLIHASGLVAQKGGVVRLAGASERILAMLHMTRTEALFPIDPDPQASLVALQSA